MPCHDPPIMIIIIIMITITVKKKRDDWNDHHYNWTAVPSGSTPSAHCPTHQHWISNRRESGLDPAWLLLVANCASLLLMLQILIIFAATHSSYAYKKKH